MHMTWTFEGDLENRSRIRKRDRKFRLLNDRTTIEQGEMLLKLVTVLLPEAYLEGLDELVRANMYPSRSSAIRSSVRDLLKKELWERRGR